MVLEPADLRRQHGIQVTAQRVAMWRAVQGRPHATADAVAEMAHEVIYWGRCPGCGSQSRT